MSPRKLTEDDKQEILEQYRNSEATTSTLATSFEVSSSTISRFLKNKLTTAEYEDLIQQKRLARTPRGEKSAAKSTSKAKATKKTKTTKADPETKKEEKKSSKSKTRTRKTKAAPVADSDAMPELAPANNAPLETEASDEPKGTRTRRRRRSSAKQKAKIEAQETVRQLTLDPEPETEALEATALDPEPETEALEATVLDLEPETEAPSKLVLDDIRSKSEVRDNSKSDRLILKSDRSESEEEEEDEMDMATLKEMLGEDEDIEDINDEEDEEEDWDEEEDTVYANPAANLNDIQILPLSQASLPRICYLVIDRSAELIVKPLAEFADLGVIPETEVRQRTLPVFDNHRIAKRFSHRRERVIKVPDGKMLQKTSHHLQEKGITRLLIDGQIYSLSR